MLRQFARNCLQLLQTLSQLYESSGDAYSIYSFMASVNGVTLLQLSPIRSSQSPCSLKLVHAQEDADFSKLPFMFKSTLDHLNSIRESDASWCTAAETAIFN